VKLKFGLLWIEDEFSAQEKQEIIDRAAPSGFELEFTVSKSGKDIEDLAKRQKLFHDFDLILLDLKLQGNVKGDELAPTIRALFRSTPILFYSGSAEAPELRDRMSKASIEGVFCAHRREFTRRAGELVVDYAPTLNRLSGMRGLAMAVVAEVDAICRRVLTKLAVGELEVLASNSLNEDIVAQAKHLDEYTSLETLEQKMNHKATDSMKSFNAFRELLKKHIKDLEGGPTKDRLSQLRLDTKEYRKKVLDIRNILGHALEVKNPDGWLIYDRYGKPCMTVANFPDYRTDFAEHLRAMREIEDILIPKD
jgi:CheY-like chemotaxis protein